jgi:hypothetical protein
MKKPEIRSVCPGRRVYDPTGKRVDAHHEPAVWPWAAVTLGPGGENPTWKAEQRVCKHCGVFFLHVVDIEKSEG